MGVSLCGEYRIPGSNSPFTLKNSPCKHLAGVEMSVQSGAEKQAQSQRSCGFSPSTSVYSPCFPYLLKIDGFDSRSCDSQVRDTAAKHGSRVNRKPSRGFSAFLFPFRTAPDKLLRAPNFPK